MNRQKELSQKEAEAKQLELEAAARQKTDERARGQASAGKKLIQLTNFRTKYLASTLFLAACHPRTDIPCCIPGQPRCGDRASGNWDRDEKGKLVYRSLQTKEIRGYPGYLGLEPKELIIRTVPMGSPAAEAKCVEDSTLVGLNTNDEIIGWEGLEGDVSRRKWDDWSDTWRVGQEI